MYLWLSGRWLKTTTTTNTGALLSLSEELQHCIGNTNSLVIHTTKVFYACTYWPGWLHFLLSQHCFFHPGPPNLTMSRQHRHWPQSLALQGLHFPHRFLFLLFLWMSVRLRVCRYIHALHARAFSHGLWTLHLTAVGFRVCILVLWNCWVQLFASTSTWLRFSCLYGKILCVVMATV